MFELNANGRGMRHGNMVVTALVSYGNSIFKPVSRLTVRALLIILVKDKTANSGKKSTDK